VGPPSEADRAQGDAFCDELQLLIAALDEKVTKLRTEMALTTLSSRYGAKTIDLCVPDDIYCWPGGRSFPGSSCLREQRHGGAGGGLRRSSASIADRRTRLTDRDRSVCFSLLAAGPSS
jgi:hypothetical protein